MVGESGLGKLATESEDLSNDLRYVVRNLPNELDEAARATTKRLKKQMRRNLKSHGAIDSGELYQSIDYEKVDDRHYSVGPDADHAGFVEYDTKPHPITPNGAGPLKFKVDGKFIQTYHVNHPGTSKQPFFEPAVNTAEENEWFEDEIMTRVEKLFERASDRP